MDNIPLVYLKRGNFVSFLDGRWVPQPDYSKGEVDELKKNNEIYVIDIDGHTKNRANLDFYRSFSRKFSFWIDAAPRFPEDVMDLFISGAHRLTIIWSIINEKDLIEIREMCTGEIYLASNDNFWETLEKVDRLGFDGVVTTLKQNPWKATKKPVWVLVNEPCGKGELRRVNS